MQERFNKDLEEIKKSQSIMNNAINEIKNTLEATNSRITEAEDRISELEDRMVEINESEKQKTAYEMVVCDWSSDVCSSDLHKLP